MEQQKKNKRGKYILLGLGVIAVAGTAVYFLTRPKKGAFTDAIINTSDQLPATVAPSTSSSSGSSASSGFPLKKGSRGELVENLQQALIDKYGASILPKYGADGHFGTETQTALTTKGHPSVVTADVFTKLVTSGGAFTTSAASTKPAKSSFNPSLVASNLRVAILDNDFDEAVKWLSRIWTVKGYTMVSDYFKEKRINGVRKTIVNALLTQFPKSSQKKKLNAMFYDIGLKYNGSKWSLSGLNQILCDRIKTIKPSMVWNSAGQKIQVPAHTILGLFMDAENEVARFKTLDGKTLSTHTNCIGYV